MTAVGDFVTVVVAWERASFNLLFLFLDDWKENVDWSDVSFKNDYIIYIYRDKES